MKTIDQYVKAKGITKSSLAERLGIDRRLLNYRESIGCVVSEDDKERVTLVRPEQIKPEKVYESEV